MSNGELDKIIAALLIVAAILFIFRTIKDGRDNTKKG